LHIKLNVLRITSATREVEPETNKEAALTIGGCKNAVSRPGLTPQQHNFEHKLCGAHSELDVQKITQNPVDKVFYYLERQALLMAW
jgi:hypothetical protein